MTRFLAVLTLLVSLAPPALARPPLSTVSEIDDPLMQIAIADDIRKRCNGIDARLVRAFSEITRLERRAKALGYSDKQIEQYVTSDAEKARMRVKAATWLATQGVDSADEASLCAFGRLSIDQQTAIGRLLR